MYQNSCDIGLVAIRSAGNRTRDSRARGSGFASAPHKQINTSININYAVQFDSSFDRASLVLWMTAFFLSLS